MAATTHGIKAGKAFVLIEAVDMTAKILNQIRNRIGRFGSEISQIGTTMALRAAAALTPAGLSLGVYAKFDDSMRIVEARTRGTAEEMQNLREQAKTLGATTAFTATHIGQLMARLAQFGKSRSDIAKMVEPIMLLARAGGTGEDLGMDIIQSTDAVTQVLAAYRLETAETANVADLLTAAVNNSKFSLEEMSTALQYAAPIAKNFNVPLTDLLAGLAGIRELGVDASIAGTAFRNMLLYVSQAKEREDFNKKLQELTGNTIEFTDAAGNLVNPLEMLVGISKALEGVGNLEASDLLTQLFETRATVPAMGLGKSVDTLARMRTVLADVAGTAKRTHDQMETGIGGTFRLLESAAEAVAIAIGESLDLAIRNLGLHTEHTLGSIRDFINAHRGWIVMTVATVAGIGLLGVSLVLLGQSLHMLSGLSFLAIVPLQLIGLLFIPGGAIIAGAILLISLLPQVRQAFADMATNSASKVTELGKSFQTVMNDIAMYLGQGQIEEAAKLMFAQLAVIWKEGVNALLTIWEDLKKAPKAGFMTVGQDAVLMIAEGWLAEMEKAPAGKFRPGAIEQQREYVRSLKETMEGSLLELAHDPATEAARTARNAELEKLRTELETLKGGAEIFRQLLTETPSPFATSPEVNAQTQADALLKAAQNLITPGQAVDTGRVAPHGNPAALRHSTEAAKQFQENKFSAFGKELEKLVALAGDQDEKLAMIEVNTRNALVGV
jgi:TP901 family phage tail tape measure protein